MDIMFPIPLQYFLRTLARIFGERAVAHASLLSDASPGDPDEVGRPILLDHCSDALLRLRDYRYGRHFRVDDLLDRHGIRAQWRSLKTEAVEPDAFFAMLEFCLKRLGLPLDFLYDLDQRVEPWSRWQRGDTLLIVTGSAELAVRRGDIDFMRPMIGVRDGAAESLLTNGVHQRLKIDARVEHIPLAQGMNPAESAAEFAHLRSLQGVGAIVVLGSPRVNSLAGAAARCVFDAAARRACPVRFRWSEFPPFGDTYLSATPLVGAAEEGIHFGGPPHQFFVPRVNDGIALEEALRGDIGPWADAGLLLVDIRARPWILLASGHGGCGTIACVLSLLQRQLDLADQLAASRFGDWFPGPGRAMQLVRVRRTKPTRLARDDFEFDHESGWDLVGPWRPPRDYQPLSPLGVPGARGSGPVTPSRRP